MKKVISLALVLVMVLTLFAGCGGNSTEETKAAAAETTPAAPAAPAATEAPVEVTEQLSGTLEYWSSWNENERQAQVMLAAADEFTKLYPDVTINFTWNGRDNRTLVVSALEAGTKIDAMDANVDNIKGLWSDYIVDLSEYMDKTYDFTNGKTYIDSVMPSMTELVAALFDGEYKAIPYNPQAYFIFCNKNIFDEAGVTSYPTTWDEFLDACAKIKAAGYTPITADGYYAPAWFGYYLSRLIGNAAVEEMAYDGTKWDNPAVLEAAKAIEEMAALGYFDPNIESNVYPAAQQDMVIGENIAMYINGTWLPSEVIDTTSDDYTWGAFAFPAVENGIEGTEAGCYSTFAIAVNKESSQEAKDIAAAFAAFLTTGKYDQMFADEANVIPVGLDATWPDTLKDAREVMMNFTSRYASQTAIVLNLDTKQIIVDACLKLMAGKITAEEFVKEASKF